MLRITDSSNETLVFDAIGHNKPNEWAADGKHAIASITVLGDGLILLSADDIKALIAAGRKALPK